MYDRYDDKIQFTIVYSSEAHPNELADPTTYEERVALAGQCIQVENINVPVLVDEMDNAVWCTYGRAPNGAYLIGTDGTIVEKQSWFDPELMEEAIINYLEGRSAA